MNRHHASILTVALTAAVGLAIALPASAQRILRRQGNVDVERSSRRIRSVPTGFRLQNGDLIIPASGASVTVQCPNGSTWNAPVGRPFGLSNVCPPPRSLGDLRGRTMQYFSGGSDPSIPFILSPRATFLRDRTPILRWNPVPGATSYLVRVTESDRTIWEITWETQTSTPEVVYPDDAPPLMPGGTYQVSVEADTGATSLDDGIEGESQDVEPTPLDFEIVDIVQRTQIEAALDALDPTGLTPEELAIAQAKLYEEYYLYADAIDTLTPFIEQGSQNPLVYEVLGKLYAQVRLNRLAADTLTQAIALADASGNAWLSAEARASLAEIKLVLGDIQEGYELLDRARAGFEAVGDLETAASVQNRLAQVEREWNL